MGAVDIGIGHDDDAFVAQIFRAVFVARAAAHGEREIGDFIVGADLGHVGRSDVEDLATDGQDRLGVAIACLFGAAAGRITFHDEQFRADRVIAGAIGEFAGQAQTGFAGRGLALHHHFLAAAQPVFHALHHEGEQRLAAFTIGHQPVIEMILDGAFHQAGGFRAGQPVLGLALELRIADEQGEHDLSPGKHVFAGQITGLLAAGQPGIILQAAGQRQPQARLMCAAIGGGNSVAIEAG